VTDDPTVPPSETPGPPPAAPVSAPASGYAALPPRGVVPADVTGVFYSKGLTIFLTIITLGIWSFLWVYRTSEDLKKYNGDGLGGVLAVVIHLLLNIVLWFTIPNEIKDLYERDGRQSPVSAIWGLWFLLPIVGAFIWYFKVQNALNDFWASKGANTVKA
jgi:hypothetical protein